MIDGLPKPDWQTDDGAVVLYRGDCLELLPKLPSGCADAVVTDPPYGGNYDTDYTRFSGSLSENRNWGGGIIGDDKPFDPSPWLAFPRVCLWGYQHFAARLPVGTTLVWLKKRDSQLGTFLSDAELAWIRGGHGAYVFRHVWHGFDRQSERGKVLHPTQKPVALMAWCIEKAKAPASGVVLDPYMGSGPTALACIQTGRRFIGIEKEERYFTIAVGRIEKALREQRERLPLEAAP